MLCAVQVTVLGWGLVFDAKPCESHQLPLLESHYLPFDDSALHPAPYTDNETDINRLLKLRHNGDSLMITAQFQASGVLPALSTSAPVRPGRQVNGPLFRLCPIHLFRRSEAVR